MIRSGSAFRVGCSCPARQEYPRKLPVRCAATNSPLVPIPDAGGGECVELGCRSFVPVPLLATIMMLRAERRANGGVDMWAAPEA